jgi:hypothetical protein
VNKKLEQEVKYPKLAFVVHGLCHSLTCFPKKSSTFAAVKKDTTHRDAQDQEATSVHVVKIPAPVLDDLLHLPVHRDDAVLVALYR